MKIAVEPRHIGFVPVVSAIETVGVTDGFIAIVIPVLETVFGLAQVAFDVNSQVIICPLVKVDVVNVFELIPAFTPSTFH